MPSTTIIMLPTVNMKTWPFSVLFQNWFSFIFFGFYVCSHARADFLYSFWKKLQKRSHLMLGILHRGIGVSRNLTNASSPCAAALAASGRLFAMCSSMMDALCPSSRNSIVSPSNFPETLLNILFIVLPPYNPFPTAPIEDFVLATHRRLTCSFAGCWLLLAQCGSSNQIVETLT